MTDEEDIVDRLRAPMNILMADDMTYEAADEIERLRKERDEARQMYCYAIPENCDEHEARKIAWERGWDCFKEDKPCQ